MRTKETESKTSSTSIVDFNLATWDEKRVSRVRCRKLVRNQSLYLGRCGETLHCAATVDDVRQATSYPVADVPDLLGDGAYIVMLRFIVLEGFQGDIKTSMITLNGQKVSCQYTAKEQDVLINGKNIPVAVVVCKAVIDEKEQVTVTTLNMKGRLMEHKWVSTPYKIKPSPKSKTVDAWQEDEQMMSLYLDHLNRKRFDIRSYLTRNPEIRAILADIMTKAVMLQPPDVATFMREQLCALGRKQPAVITDVTPGNQLDEQDKNQDVEQ
ncbi:ciliogenesis-associated TTC17-interacting protein-like isoform X2 [Bacillus rossius redtenbacheri]